MRIITELFSVFHNLADMCCQELVEIHKDITWHLKYDEEEVSLLQRVP